METLDLRGRHAGKTLESKEGAGIRKRLERRAVHLDRLARFLCHSLANAARLEDRDAVPDDEGAGGLIGRVKEDRSKIPVLGLQPADDGIAASDIGESVAIDVERDRCQRLLPGA